MISVLVLGASSHSKTHSIATEVYRTARERIGLFHLGIVEERAAHFSAYWISRRRILEAMVWNTCCSSVVHCEEGQSGANTAIPIGRLGS